MEKSEKTILQSVPMDILHSKIIPIHKLTIEQLKSLITKNEVTNLYEIGYEEDIWGNIYVHVNAKQLQTLKSMKQL